VKLVLAMSKSSDQLLEWLLCHSIEPFLVELKFVALMSSLPGMVK